MAKQITAKELLLLSGQVYHGVLADMDGTLLDSMGMWKQIDQDFLEKRGIPFDESYTTAVKTMTFTQAAVYTKERYDLPESSGEIVDEWNTMAKGMYETTIQMKPGADVLLDQWKERNIPVAICTVSQRVISQAAVKHHKLDRVLSAVVDMESTGKGKDEPDIFLFASNAIGVSPEKCLLLEDSLQAMRTAKKAGYTVCAVYEKTAEKDLPKILEVADYYLDSFI